MAEENSGNYDSIKRKCVSAVTNPFFILGLVMVSLSEASLIHKLWVKPKYPVDPISAFGLQIAFLMPFLFISVFWYKIDRQIHKEGISPSFAEELNRGLLVFLTALYLLVPTMLSSVTH